MKYRKDRYGNEISVLGFGCMRFTGKPKIDYAKAESEILRSIELGVNYFDTAYLYPGSEALLGEVFEKNGLRDRVYIATKLPHYLVKKREHLDKYFDQELERLKTDHVDYYLMHMLTDIGSWERLCSLGILEWIDEKKKNGQIRQIGFSYHGNSEMFMRICDAYDWDMTMIQYNYMDEYSQAGRDGLDHAASIGLPVVIMEPLRGGKLVRDLPKEAVRLMKESSRDYTPAQWSFQWLWSQKDIMCVLSGMNSIEMVEENCHSAEISEIDSMTDEDRNLLKEVVDILTHNSKIGCTGCRYCMPCPRHVDIPGTFAAYERSYVDGRIPAMYEYFKCTALRKEKTGASVCIGCGACEKHCPQAIEIRKELKKAEKRLEGPIYNISRKFVGIMMKY